MIKFSHKFHRKTKNPQNLSMCKSKKKIMRDVIEPITSPTSTITENLTTTTSSYNYKDSWQSSTSSLNSLHSLRNFLPESPHIYEFSEICSATNNFLAQKYSSSSSSASWKCTLRRNEVIVFQRKLRRQMNPNQVEKKLALICKSHYTSLIKLRGVSLSGNYIYLVYDFVSGANLSDCLRNAKNPNFTVLSSWMSRIQIATDMAQGLDYIHHSTGLSLSFVHNHIKSTSIIVTEPELNAKICHFGTAELCGESVSKEDEENNSETSNFKRSKSRRMKVEGTRGYMSPEFQSTGVCTRKSDIFAFGVVILELISGKEALKYTFDEDSGGYVRTSVIETARRALEGDGVGWRSWVDRRLKDSYPMEAVEKLVRLGLECVEEDPEKRPDMGWVAGRISKLYLESQTWAEKMGQPTGFSVSLGPR